MPELKQQDVLKSVRIKWEQRWARQPASQSGSLAPGIKPPAFLPPAGAHLETWCISTFTTISGVCPLLTKLSQVKLKDSTVRIRQIPETELKSFIKQPAFFLGLFPPKKAELYFSPLSDTTCSQPPAPATWPESHSCLRRFTKCFVKWTSAVVPMETSEVTSQHAEGRLLRSGGEGAVCPAHCHPDTGSCAQLRARGSGEGMGFQTHWIRTLLPV